MPIDLGASKSHNIPKIELGFYRHYKGKLYEVVGVAAHTETLEPLVVYKPLYESDVKLWVRPYEMFINLIQIDGNTIPRFEKVD